MLTTMDVEVLELCTMTVTSTPIISPATGLDIIESLLKNCPAIFPGKNKPTVTWWGVKRAQSADVSPSPAGTYGIVLHRVFSQGCPDTMRHAHPPPDPRSSYSFTLPSFNPSLCQQDLLEPFDREPGLLCVLGPMGASESPDVLFPVSGMYFRFLRVILQVDLFILLYPSH